MHISWDSLSDNKLQWRSQMTLYGAHPNGHDVCPPILLPGELVSVFAHGAYDSMMHTIHIKDNRSASSTPGKEARAALAINESHEQLDKICEEQVLVVSSCTLELPLTVCL